MFSRPHLLSRPLLCHEDHCGYLACRKTRLFFSFSLPSSRLRGHTGRSRRRNFCIFLGRERSSSATCARFSSLRPCNSTASAGHDPQLQWGRLLFPCWSRGLKQKREISLSARARDILPRRQLSSFYVSTSPYRLISSSLDSASFFFTRKDSIEKIPSLHVSIFQTGMLPSIFPETACYSACRTARHSPLLRIKECCLRERRPGTSIKKRELSQDGDTGRRLSVVNSITFSYRASSPLGEPRESLRERKSSVPLLGVHAQVMFLSSISFWCSTNPRPPVAKQTTSSVSANLVPPLHRSRSSGSLFLTPFSCSSRFLLTSQRFCSAAASSSPTSTPSPLLVDTNTPREVISLATKLASSPSVFLSRFSSSSAIPSFCVSPTSSRSLRSSSLPGLPLSSSASVMWGDLVFKAHGILHAFSLRELLFFLQLLVKGGSVSLLNCTKSKKRTRPPHRSHKGHTTVARQEHLSLTPVSSCSFQSFPADSSLTSPGYKLMSSRASSYIPFAFGGATAAPIEFLEAAEMHFLKHLDLLSFEDITEVTNVFQLLQHRHPSFISAASERIVLSVGPLRDNGHCDFSSVQHLIFPHLRSPAEDSTTKDVEIYHETSVNTGVVGHKEIQESFSYAPPLRNSTRPRVERLIRIWHGSCSCGLYAPDVAGAVISALSRRRRQGKEEGGLGSTSRSSARLSALQIQDLVFLVRGCAMHLARRPILHSTVLTSPPSDGPSSFCSQSSPSCLSLSFDRTSFGVAGSPAGERMPSMPGEMADERGGEGGQRQDRERETKEESGEGSMVGDHPWPDNTAVRLGSWPEKKEGDGGRMQINQEEEEVERHEKEHDEDEEAQLDWHVAGLMLRGLQSIEEKMHVIDSRTLILCLDALALLSYTPGSLIDKALQGCFLSRAPFMRPEEILGLTESLAALGVQYPELLQALGERVMHIFQQFELRALIRLAVNFSRLDFPLTPLLGELATRVEEGIATLDNAELTELKALFVHHGLPHTALEDYLSLNSSSRTNDNVSYPGYYPDAAAGRRGSQTRSLSEGP
ncbi:hypothetical protein CSUI_000739 [Cystoisospora suis]|uniref:Uncharacterized protein n=1 Tax=Cystoisospora suis TaxID=483139 RepID=A0A2C6LFQ4_9APIC|nr:hypothetical protein CSUI_000739 [Cystoisospora suis]